MDYAGLVFRSMQPCIGAIDDRTWQDLNMDLVFAKLDRTHTWPGMQRLYQMLRSPPLIREPARLKQRSEMIRSFEEDQVQREAVQLILGKMDGHLGAGLPTLLWETPPCAENASADNLHNHESRSAFVSSSAFLRGGSLGGVSHHIHISNQHVPAF